MTSPLRSRRATTLVEALSGSLQSILAQRTLRLRTDVDPAAWIEASDGFDALLRTLLHAACQTAPAESELYLSIARPAARLTRVGDVEIVLRWQVEGAAEGDTEGVVVPLRPEPKGAPAVAGSELVGALTRGFASEGWRLDVTVIQEPGSAAPEELRGRLRPGAG